MLFEKLKSNRILAMKAKDSAKTSLLSTLIGEIENKSKSGKNKSVINDDAVIAICKSFIKNIEITISALHKAQGNTDKEMAELKILSDYMPKALTSDETIVIVTNTIEKLKINSIKDMGKLMGKIKKEYGARVDMSLVSKLVREKLL